MLLTILTLYVLYRVLWHLRWRVFSSIHQKQAENILIQRNQREYDFEKEIAGLDTEKIANMDVTRLREGLIQGEFTSTDLVNVFAERCYRIGRGLQLTTQENFLAALKIAEERDEELRQLKDEGPDAIEEKLGILHGIPFAVKDTIH